MPEPLLNFRTSGISNTNHELLESEKDRLLAKEFPCLTPDQRRQLTDNKTMCADTLFEIAGAHLDDPKFVKASRALFEDRRVHNGKRWQSDAFDTLGDTDFETWPKISVIVPFYEAETSIGECLDSVLAQSLSEFEVICINDCAVDDSQAIVDDHMARDRRIKSFRNDGNIGLGASRNAGVRVANGRYIFHLDPDDTLPANALEALYSTATEHKSDMVKGAYRASQGLHRQESAKAITKYPCGIEDQIVTNTTLKEMPRLLRTTEGHWSYLYAATFARQTPYPTDLKMGQDSMFMVNAVPRARSISLIPDVVYNYQANPESAMNHFTARKLFDALEWRRRAWHVLNDAGMTEIGEHMLFAYWSRAFFESVDKILTAENHALFEERLGRALSDAEYPGNNPPSDPVLRQRFDQAVARIGNGKMPANASTTSNDGTSFRVATFSTQDHGGAGIGSQRRVEYLRKAGLDARIYCALRNTDHDYVHQLPLATPGSTEIQLPDARAHWKEKVVLRRSDFPDLKANELFSKPESIVDFRNAKSVFEEADIVHMHWVSGVFDYKNVDVIAEKPIVWTLADMSAFTGGCHYSEGCEGYQTDCKNCPLLGGESDLAHQFWRIKRDAYAKLKNLHIICPSQWLADRVRNSTLLGDRPVHMIPNALPVDRFKPTNRLVARKRLGLPLDRKLIAFGADSLGNSRKGGDILRAAIQILKSRNALDGIEGIFFGHGGADFGIPAHEMGQVSDEETMSLIYAAADIFAFPSREDNAPLTVVESMLSGTPVVGFPVGNVVELIEHRVTGYIAQQGDIEDFATGIEWALAGRSSATTLDRRAQNHIDARAHNDPEIAVARHIALYEKITGSAVDRGKRYGVFGASLTGQGVRHDSGEALGYVEFLKRKHAANVNSRSANIKRFCYPGNRLSDGGMIALDHVISEKPDICILELAVENQAVGRLATHEEVSLIYSRLLDNGILPVTFLVPLPIGRKPEKLPNFTAAVEICEQHGLPILIADTQQIAASGAEFNDVHTTAESGEKLADQLADFLSALPFDDLKRQFRNYNIPQSTLKSQRLSMPSHKDLERICIRIEPRDDQPFRFRIVQRHEIGPHSPVLDVRTLDDDNAGDGWERHSVSVWDQYCHYSRKSYVTLLPDDREYRGAVSVEISIASDSPDYSRCRRSVESWPAPEELSLRPIGAIYILADSEFCATISDKVQSE
ncbi:glycosyltransferase [Parasphingopyxis sp. CP4]|uniref:glycosyltransferase n=1 Tax=Parasphingopyxis sp. CP4 TaxID=2724527 RepID=UPI0021042E84|nr:glycosyltransferase [Parasphingopyxis sp. CP4]